MPSANMAVAMANLDRLPDTPECQGLRSSVRAHLIAAMGQTATLLKRVQAISYTEVSSDQTHRSQTSPQPSERHRSRSPNDRRKDVGRGNRGRDTGGYREQKRGRGQEVNQDRDLRYNIPPKDARATSTGAPRKERRTKTCGALSTMPHMAPRPETVFFTPSPSRMAPQL